MKIENINFLKKHLQNLAESEPELKTKIEKISEILSQTKIKDLTNRKSKVHLSASAVVFNKNINPIFRFHFHFHYQYKSFH